MVSWLNNALLANLHVFLSNLDISHQERCPHPAREDTVLCNLLILFC